MEGWNYGVRLYEPEKAILDGSYIFPSVAEVTSAGASQGSRQDVTLRGDPFSY